MSRGPIASAGLFLADVSFGDANLIIDVFHATAVCGDILGKTLRQSVVDSAGEGDVAIFYRDLEF